MQMMSGQPTTEQIVRKFVWCQRDAGTQRLYYIHKVRQSSSHATEVIGHKLSAIQFHSDDKFDNMVCDFFFNFFFLLCFSITCPLCFFSHYFYNRVCITSAKKEKKLQHGLRTHCCSVPLSHTLCLSFPLFLRMSF